MEEGSSATDFVTDVTDVTELRKKEERLVPRSPLTPLKKRGGQKNSKSPFLRGI
jgi:hypothetical protein